MKPIYTAPNPNGARAALEDLDEKWGKKYGAIIRLWESAWEEFIPFLDYDLSDPHGDLLHECDRIPQRPLPARGPSAGSFPDRVGGAEVPGGTSGWRLPAGEILSPVASTPPVVAAPDGRATGSQLGARLPSASPAAGRSRKPTK